MKYFYLLLLCPLVMFSQIQIGQDIFGEHEDDESASATSISSDGSIIAIGASRNDANAYHSGQVKIFENIDGVWIQVGQTLEGDNELDRFGQSVSLSDDGSIIAVGLDSNTNINGQWTGAVRVFQNISGVWIQIGDDIIGENPNDRFGNTVSLSSNGNIIAVGAWLSYSSAGSVRVFENINGSWIQIGGTMIGEASGDYSSRSISLSSDGTTVAIGATNNHADTPYDVGHARVYRNINNVWTQLGSDIDGDDTSDRFGTSVGLSLDGNIVAIGAEAADYPVNGGQVKILEFINGSWTQIGDDIIGGDSFQYLGSSLSLSDDGLKIAIGSDEYSGFQYGMSFNGLVQIYYYQEGSWMKLGRNILGRGDFGYSTSLSSDGNVMIAGGPFYGYSGNPSSGYAKVYDVSNDTLLSTQELLTSEYSIYPNPTKSQVTIQLNNTDQLEKVSLYNTLGQVVITSKKPVIDTSKLTSGTYIVEITTNQGTMSKQLIKE